MADDDDEQTGAEESTDEEAEAPSAPAVDGEPPEGPSGSQTMRVDAMVEEVEEGAPIPDDALAQVLPDSSGAGAAQISGLPPPLPPKKVGKGTIIAGVVVVIVAAAGGIIFGMNFLEPEPVVEESGVSPVEREEPEAVDEEPVFVPLDLEEVIVPHPDEELLEETGEEEFLEE